MNKNKKRFMGMNYPIFLISSILVIAAAPLSVVTAASTAANNSNISSNKTLLDQLKEADKLQQNLTGEKLYEAKEKYYIEMGCMPVTYTDSSHTHVKSWRCPSGTLSYEDNIKSRRELIQKLPPQLPPLLP